jgi:hypothetical protein
MGITFTASRYYLPKDEAKMLHRKGPAGWLDTRALHRTNDNTDTQMSFARGFWQTGWMAAWATGYDRETWAGAKLPGAGAPY